MKYDRNTDRSVVLSNMVEVKFVEGPEEGFRKVKETLQRMGLPKKSEKVLYQTAHILHKQGQYYVCHFKELFALDGREAILSEGDIGRRNLIIKCLIDWNLIEPVKDSKISPISSPRSLKVLRHQDREDWVLESKYAIGVKKDKYNNQSD